MIVRSSSSSLFRLAAASSRRHRGRRGGGGIGGAVDNVVVRAAGPTQHHHLVGGGPRRERSASSSATSTASFDRRTRPSPSSSSSAVAAERSASGPSSDDAATTTWTNGGERRRRPATTAATAAVPPPSFLDGVDEMMKRDSPMQYRMFLDSRSKFRDESRRGEVEAGEERRTSAEVDVDGWRLSPRGMRGTASSTQPRPEAAAPRSHPSDVVPGGVVERDDGAAGGGPAFEERETLGSGGAGNRHPDDLDAPEPRARWHDDAGAFAGGGPAPAGGGANGGGDDDDVDRRPDAASGGTTTRQNSARRDLTGREPGRDGDGESPSSNGKKMGGGAFSAISETSSAPLDFGNNKVGSILLSELFPSLYSSSANDPPKKEEGPTPLPRRRRTDPSAMYDRDHFDAYEQAMTAVFAEAGTVRAMSRFEAGRGKRGPTRGDPSNDGDVVRRVKKWLLSDHRVVDAESVRKRWKNVEGAWTDERWIITGDGTTTTTITDVGGLPSIGGEGIGGEGGETGDGDSKFASELRAQREAFLSKLLMPSPGGGVGGGVGGRDDGDPAAPSGEEEEVVAVDPVRFYEITQHLMGSLARYCARRARSSPMVVAWYKVKECGILLPKDTVATFLYVCGTMGMADSIGMMSSGIGSSLSYPDDDRGGGGGGMKNGSRKEEEERFLVPEEVATYHDLSSKPTEASISLRIKSLVSKGDARGAESMLEAFKVRDYCVVVGVVIVVVVGECSGRKII
jgi:hypothetical protein